MTTTEVASDVPVQTRRDRPTGTHREDFAPLSSRSLEWRFAPLPKISPIVDGPLDGNERTVSVTGATSLTVDVAWVALDDKRVGSVGLPEDRAAAAGWEATTRVCVVSVSGEQSDDVELSFDLSSSATKPGAIHLIVDAAPHTVATLVLRYSGDIRVIENHELLIGAGSNVTIVNLYEETTESVHLATHFARIGRDASLRHSAVVLSGGVVRVNPSAHLAESGADVTLLGLYTPGENEHAEHHVYVNHDAPHTTSNVLYKGALRAASARSVWIGDVLIGQKATGTDSYEQNRNLILREGARADSIPNLEIETGDIVGAGHASATGRFDEEQLFYLSSRGISEADARMLVVRGFLNEVAQQVGSPKVADIVEATLDKQFAEGV